MTVSQTASNAIFLGNGSTTVFTANINNGVPFNSTTSLASYTLIYTDVNGNQSVINPTLYSLSFTAAVTGALWGAGVSCTYPLSGSPIASGTSLTLSRIFPLQQLTSISNQGDFAPQNIEAMGDIEEMQLQQIAARTAQQRGVWATGVQYNAGDLVVDGANGANTGNYYQCAIPNVSATWSSDLAAGDWTLAINIQVIAGYATTASSAATSATASATTASSAATTASSAATTASSAATTASSAATTASSAATTASSAATSASASATSAASSAATAATYAGTNALNVFSGNGVTTTFTLSSSPTTKNNVQVYISGVYQQKSNYSISGSTLTFVTAPSTGTNNVEAIVTTAAASSSGTVTSASVVSANGFSGTVANPTTTPAFTLSTTITGVLKGNGNAILAATAGTDYQAPISLTTTGSSGAATFSGNTLNIPNYSASYVAGTGLTLTGNSFAVNTSQNIATLSNLTSNGIVTTSGGVGTLSVTATTGSGSVVLATSPTLVTPALGTPSSGTLTNCTFPTLNQNTSGQAGTVNSIATNISPGTNVTITGSGTIASPYVVNSTNTASTAFSALTGSTNTSAAMVVGTGASISATGSGAITATAVAVGGITGLGTGVATFLATPSSANLLSALTTSTGTGNAVFATSPTLVTPALGTPASGVLTNCTGTASGLTAGTVTTNANMTGDVTSSGSNATTVAKIAGVSVGTPTGTGNVVFSNSPTLVTPALGTPASGNLANCTGYPVTVNGVSTFSGNGATTAFTLGGTPTSKNNTLVYIFGVYQQKANYTLAGAVITFTTAPASGTSNIEVIYS